MDPTKVSLLIINVIFVIVNVILLKIQGDHTGSERGEAGGGWRDALIVWAAPMAAILVFLTIFYDECMSAGQYPTGMLLTQIGFMFIPMLVFPVAYMRRVRGWRLNDFGLTTVFRSKKTWLGGILFGFIWTFLQVSSVNPAPVAFLVLSIYSPSFIEELVGRSIIQSRMIDSFGDVKGLLAASFLFGLWHIAGDLIGLSFQGVTYMNGLNVLLTLAIQVQAGILLGIIYWKTGSLAPAIIVHYLLDFGGATLAWIV